MQGETFTLTERIEGLKENWYERVLRIIADRLIKILLTYGAEPFLSRSQICSYSRISQHFMEPEVSLQCSQVPSTGPYPEPDHPILSL
jgi:hypothetical protein